jgi:hypothetical protein
LSSSTSSSEGRPRRLWRKLLGPTTLVVVVVLLLIEAFSRTALVGASKDLRRFRGYPAAARALVAAPGLHVALIGNSATERGVDDALLSDGLTARAGRPVLARKFVADASRVNDWHFMLERFFWDTGARPDLFVVTFYEDDLEDGNRIEIGRFAQFFTQARDWPNVFDVDVDGLGDRVDFLISSAWMTFAVRSRIRDRLMGVNENLDDFLMRVNRVNRQRLMGAGQRAGRPGATVHGYRALDRLLAVAAAHGAHVLFVAYPPAPPPANQPYVIPEDTLAHLRAGHAELLDMRDKVPLIQPRHYADDVHLSPEGARLYSQALAEALAPHIPR